MATLTTPYELTFDQRPFYLQAYIRSEIATVETSLSYLQEIADKCMALRYTRLMIERDIPATLSEPELQTVALEFDMMGIGDIKVAFLDERAEDPVPQQSGLIAGTNRGAWTEVFTNIADAERWLLT